MLHFETLRQYSGVYGHIQYVGLTDTTASLPFPDTVEAGDYIYVLTTMPTAPTFPVDWTFHGQAGLTVARLIAVGDEDGTTFDIDVTPYVDPTYNWLYVLGGPVNPPLADEQDIPVPGATQETWYIQDYTATQDDPPGVIETVVDPQNNYPALTGTERFRDEAITLWGAHNYAHIQTITYDDRDSDIFDDDTPTVVEDPDLTSVVGDDAFVPVTTAVEDLVEEALNEVLPHRWRSQYGHYRIDKMLTYQSDRGDNETVSSVAIVERDEDRDIWTLTGSDQYDSNPGGGSLVGEHNYLDRTSTAPARLGIAFAYNPDYVPPPPRVSGSTPVKRRFLTVKELPYDLHDAMRGLRTSGLGRPGNL